MNSDYKHAIEKYLHRTNKDELNLRLVLFDMDGVLFDSMPFHAESWQKTLDMEGIKADVKEFFKHEGRTSKQTIDIFFEENNRKIPTDEEAKAIYKTKESIFNQYPPVSRIAGTLSLVEQMRSEGLRLGVVTGSAQGSLLQRLDTDYQEIFDENVIVTAFDVKHGKPDPEPYLMGLQKAGVKNNEAIVIENAPLGVESAVKAGIFTIAVNTGPLDKQLLIDAGADLVFDSMNQLSDDWKILNQVFSS